jgi:protein-S-isoprenylcysteine O-methyltransferase Ste14
MSWIPAFKIGLWNAWILMLVVLFHPLIMIILDKAFGRGDIFKKMGEVPYEKGEKRIYTIFLMLLLLLTVYSVFLPLFLGTIWFYFGLLIWLAGLAIFLTAIVNIATTPIGQVFRNGMYRFSRHPMYIAMLAFFLGISVASASWVFLLLTVVCFALLKPQAEAEERGCLKTYGDEYKEYMNKTPRWIGIPKSR